MAASQNSEKFNAIFKNKSLSDSYNALQLLPPALPSLPDHAA